jgi:hypothetical protein
VLSNDINFGILHHIFIPLCHRVCGGSYRNELFWASGMLDHVTTEASVIGHVGVAAMLCMRYTLYRQRGTQATTIIFTFINVEFVTNIGSEIPSKVDTDLVH